MVYLKFGTGEAMLVIAVGIVFILDIVTGQPWSGYVLSVVATMIAFYGGALAKKQ